MDIKVTLKWAFTPRESPEDECPMLPKFENYESRLHSFDVLRSSKGYEEEHAKWLAKLGFSFSFSKHKEYVVLCFDCGCATNPVLTQKFVNENPNEICMRFYHHKHCKHIKTLAETKWCLMNHRTDEPALDDMPFEAYEKKVQEFAKKQREKAKLGKANKSGDDKQMEKSVATKMQESGDDKQETRKTTLLCQDCGQRPKEVEFYPCLHDNSCISCAKKKTTCFTCKLPYSGLARAYGSGYEYSYHS